MKILTCLMILLSVGVLFFTVVLADSMPGGDGVVASETLPDGTEVRVTQKWNSFVEPYSVTLCIKEPGREWEHLYLDHEDTRWRECRIEHDEVADTVSVWKGEVHRGLWKRRENLYERPDVSGWVADVRQDKGEQERD